MPEDPYRYFDGAKFKEDDDDHGELPLICPVTGSPCTTEQDEFCEDYGCARKAGIDVDRDLIL